MITAEHIELSIKRANEGQSNLSQEQLAVRGFSTPTIRRIFSNLCNLGEGTYLEIGLFCGATFVSSFNTGMTCIGVENHSQDFSEGFETVKRELKENVDKFSERAKEVHIHYADCFDMDMSLIPDNIDIYFFDGEHSELSQSKALPHFIDKMAKTFVYVCDDINWPEVFNGTNKGFEQLKDKIEIDKVWLLRGYNLQDDPIYHNGVGIYLINKK